jgi:hypothetical protein
VNPRRLGLTDLMASIVSNATHYLAPIPSLPDDVYPEAHAIRVALLRYNAEPTAEYNVPVYGTACIDTRDCYGIFEQLRTLDTGIGHLIVTLSFTAFNLQFHERFEQFEKLFPGRFTYIRRPEGSSCVEGWNAVLAIGFSIRPRPKYVMIVCGDTMPNPGSVPFLASQSAATYRDRYLTRIGPYLVMFTITQRGLNEVGFFDENVFPVYEEDIEWMMRTMRLQNSRRPDGSYFSPREARRPDRVVQLPEAPTVMYVERKWNSDPRVATIIGMRSLRWNKRSRSYKWDVGGGTTSTQRRITSRACRCTGGGRIRCCASALCLRARRPAFLASTVLGRVGWTGNEWCRRRPPPSDVNPSVPLPQRDAALELCTVGFDQSVQMSQDASSHNTEVVHSECRGQWSGLQEHT